MSDGTWPEWEHVLGSLDGIETGVRQLIRERPLQTVEVAVGGTNLAEYRRPDPRWHDWRRVADACAAIAAGIFDRL